MSERCNSCSFDSDDAWELIAHRLVSHGVGSVITCDDCDTVYSSDEGQFGPGCVECNGTKSYGVSPLAVPLDDGPAYDVWCGETAA